MEQLSVRQFKRNCTHEIHNAAIGDNFEIRLSSRASRHHAENHLATNPDGLQARPATDERCDAPLRLSKVLAENNNPPSTVPRPARLPRTFIVLVEALSTREDFKTRQEQQ
jgi:hypothetical protein